MRLNPFTKIIYLADFFLASCITCTCSFEQNWKELIVSDHTSDVIELEHNF